MLEGKALREAIDAKLFSADAFLQSRVVLIDFGECYDADMPANPLLHAQAKREGAKVVETKGNWLPKLEALVSEGGQGVGGLSTFLPPEAKTSNNGCFNYEKSDIYGLGYTLLELANATVDTWDENVWTHTTPEANIATLKQRSGDDKFSDVFIALLENMVKLKFDERISAADAYHEIMNMCPSCKKHIRPLSPPNTPPKSGSPTSAASSSLSSSPAVSSPAVPPPPSSVAPQ